MEILLVIGLVALVAVVASALGEVWGPLLIGLGFAGWGSLVLVSGYISPWPEIGVGYLGGSLAEFAAAREFWRCRGSRSGPSVAWRVMAALVGIAGTLLVGVLVMLVAIAIAGFYSQL